MKIFEKRQPEKSNWNQGVVHSVASRLERSMRRLAALLGALSERLSMRQKKIALSVFGLLTACICTTLIIRPFTVDEAEGFSMPVEIQPAALHALPTQEDSLLEQSTYKSLVRIRRAIDSLKYSSQGQSRYDQLLRERPGLLDSLNALLNE